ncbi:MAG: hypothetical protein ACKOE9_00430, partial [Vulcanococcus sp.]
MPAATASGAACHSGSGEGQSGDRTAQPNPTAPQDTADQAPPPPPSEPWMEQLSALDGGGPG